MAKPKTSGHSGSQPVRFSSDSRGKQPSSDTVAVELLRELDELPGVVRRLVGRHLGLAEELTHGAEVIASALMDLDGTEPEDLRRGLLQVQACVERLDRVLHALHAFVGEMKGLAWAAEAGERAQRAARDQEVSDDLVLSARQRRASAHREAHGKEQSGRSGSRP